jgi:hypothetical protein
MFRVSLSSRNRRLNRVYVVSEPSPKRYKCDIVGLHRCPTTRYAETGCPATRGRYVKNSRSDSVYLLATIPCYYKDCGCS